MRDNPDTAIDFDGNYGPNRPDDDQPDPTDYLPDPDDDGDGDDNG